MGIFEDYDEELRNLRAAMEAILAERELAEREDHDRRVVERRCSARGHCGGKGTV